MRLTAPSTQPTWVGRGFSRRRDFFITFQTRFRLRFFNLTSPTIVTRRSILQKVRHHLRALTIASTRFQVLFHSHSGAFHLFPHGTGSLSVTRVFSLASLADPDGIPRVPLRIKDYSWGTNQFSYAGLCLFGAVSHQLLLSNASPR